MEKYNMIVGCNWLSFVVFVFCSSVSATQTLLLAGEVKARKGQSIVAPRSESWQQQIKWIAPEGEPVKAGEVIVIFEAANTQNNIKMKEAELRSARSKAEEESLRLNKELMEQEQRTLQAELNVAKAKVDADVPLKFQSKFQYDERQYQLQKAIREEEKQRLSLADKVRAINLATEQQKIDVKRISDELTLLKQQLASYDIRAERDGVIVYSDARFNGNRIGTGASVQQGMVIATVPFKETNAILAYVHEFDVSYIQKNQSVKIVPDSDMGRELTGTVVAIAYQSEKKTLWGDAFYREVWIEPNDPQQIEDWLQGMSVRVEYPL